VSNGRQSGLRVITQERDGSQLVTLTGQIDERADLPGLADRLGGDVQFVLEEVSFINSIGTRNWCRLMHRLIDAGARIHFARCSEAMVQQMNMVVDVKGTAAIDSFFAPYLCPVCQHEASLLVEVAPNLDRLRAGDVPTQPCPACSASMEFAELPERYLLFLDS